jgi:hypothetical protein
MKEKPLAASPSRPFPVAQLGSLPRQARSSLSPPTRPARVSAHRDAPARPSIPRPSAFPPSRPNAPLHPALPSPRPTWLARSSAPATLARRRCAHLPSVPCPLPAASVLARAAAARSPEPRRCASPCYVARTCPVCPQPCSAPARSMASWTRMRPAPRSAAQPPPPFSPTRRAPTSQRLRQLPVLDVPSNASAPARSSYEPARYSLPYAYAQPRRPVVLDIAVVRARQVHFVIRAEPLAITVIHVLPSDALAISVYVKKLAVAQTSERRPARPFRRPVRLCVPAACGRHGSPPMQHRLGLRVAGVLTDCPRLARAPPWRSPRARRLRRSPEQRLARSFVVAAQQDLCRRGELRLPGLLSIYFMRKSPNPVPNRTVVAPRLSSCSCRKRTHVHVCTACRRGLDDVRLPVDDTRLPTVYPPPFPPSTPEPVCLPRVSVVLFCRKHVLIN